MRYAFLLLALSAQAATLTLEPPVIYDCTGTFGKATVRWKDASGQVQVLVGPSRAVFTGFGDTSGSAETGTWVGDGLQFELVNRRGVVEASAMARVACDARNIPGNGLVGDNFFPLETGNTWTYRVDSRTGTSEYVRWMVTAVRRIGGRDYSEITSTTGNISTIVGLFREEAGRIHRFMGTLAAPREELYFNSDAAQRRPFRNELGSYPDAAFQVSQQSLIREEQVFVRGVGLARTNAQLLTGSSGGFASSMELVEFHLATGPRVEGPITPRISISVESLFLDVTGRQLTNCAIPCYFVACGLGSPVDPPGTYKPCVRTRVEAAA
jgi:hypothetical protein